MGSQQFCDKQHVAETLADEQSPGHHSRETAQANQEPCRDAGVMVGCTASTTKAGRHRDDLD